ncbi:MAG TPA: outer membrane beta-barrel protein [Chitinophagaceae bacterium]|nr:outer membrane beta-barrel protein [Chitinophagaceae bacterium]
MKKLLLLILMVCVISGLSWSQGTLKGKIIDSSSSKPLGFATITVFKAADTVIITYRLSTPEGNFKVTGIPFDLNCRAVISYSGYSVYRKEFMLTASQSILDIGSVYLTTDTKSLDEVLVMAERPPVVMKKDTIEFNASAFKTLPNALVEDLLKKLPGVMVDKEGNIAVNGKPVNRILVDGKTFFGDDPKMATRNLPANVIDKVQVTDDKEEMMRNGDDNPNNVGKVVNITLKKGVKKGWFGKMYAGDGTNRLYEAGGIANIYRDTLQLSVLGYMNNLNKAGFSYSELMSSGGFDRIRSNSASNSISSWNNNGGSGISINGINFGGSQNFGGISTSKGVGFNLNLAPNKKKSMYLQYFNGNVHAPRLTVTDINQFISDTVINNHTTLTGDMITHGHNIGIGLRLKPDSVTNILLNANYLIGIQDEDRFSDITGNNNKTGPLSDGHIIQNNDAKTFYYKHGLSITRLSKKKKGRRFNFNHNLDINNRFNDYMSESDISYFYPTAYDSTYSQLRKERIPRTDAVVSFNYSEPISKHFTIRTGGRYEYSKLNNGVSTYNQNSNGKFEVLNTLLSSDFKRVSNRIVFSPVLEYKWKDLTISPGIRFLQQNVNNRLVSSAITLKQDQFNVLPTFLVVYKQLSVGYNKDVNLPGFNSLNPVADISNPYFITKGNPDLLSSRRDNISLNYYFNDSKRYLNAGGYISASFTNNDIVPGITVDNRGVQTSIPVNANGSRNYSMNWNINKQYKNKQNIIFMWNTGNWMNINKNRLLYNGTDSWQTTFNYNHWFGIGLNLDDKFEWNLSYSFGKNFTKYTSSYFKKLNVSNYNWGNEMVLRWPKHLIWETQVSYSYNGSIPAGLPKEAIKWNAALNITMLKNESAVLKFSVNDILDRNNSINVNANRNMINTTQNNILGRYFLVTLTYNVRPAGAKRKVGGRERLFMF